MYIVTQIGAGLVPGARVALVAQHSHCLRTHGICMRTALHLVCIKVCLQVAS